VRGAYQLARTARLVAIPHPGFARPLSEGEADYGELRGRGVGCGLGGAAVGCGLGGAAVGLG
jgi:hypothetical protein